MKENIKNWWLRVQIVWYLFRNDVKRWNDDEFLYNNIKKIVAENIAGYIIRDCNLVYNKDLDTTLEGLYLMCRNANIPIEIVYRCIEQLYITHFGGFWERDEKQTPLYLAGYHQGLTDGAAFLDKVPPFADSDDASVNTQQHENVQETGDGFQIFDPMDRSSEDNVVNMKTVVAREGDDIKIDFVKENKKSDAENLD